MKKYNTIITLLVVVVIFLAILTHLLIDGRGLVTSIQASVFLGLIVGIPLLSLDKKEPIE